MASRNNLIPVFNPFLKENPIDVIKKLREKLKRVEKIRDIAIVERDRIEVTLKAEIADLNIKLKLQPVDHEALDGYRKGWEYEKLRADKLQSIIDEMKK